MSEVDKDFGDYPNGYKIGKNGKKVPISPGRKKFNLSETEIRYAFENTKSIRAAARFLKVDVITLKKYAKQYIDEKTGKDLYELHKNQAGVGIRKGYTVRKRGHHGLDDILEGKFPTYRKYYSLKKRIISEARLEEKCETCGYDTRRISDYSVPLLLDWIDGDKTNHKLENLRLLCYNCYYQEVGNILGGRHKWKETLWNLK